MNKRNLLLLLCILLAVAMLMVSCGKKTEDEAPHVCTFSNDWSSDADGHWHASTCAEHPNAKSAAGAHADSNIDGKCDTCDYVTCPAGEHTYDETQWVSDDVNHWHAANCGCALIKDSAAHDDADKNGICDTCEYVLCTHEAAVEWSTDLFNHWHEIVCDCLVDVKHNYGPHTYDENGECTDCGEAMPSVYELIEGVTSSEAAAKVTGGVVYDDRFMSSVYTEYNLYSGYTTYTLWGGTYYLSSYLNKDGVPTLFKVAAYNYDGETSVEYDSFALDVEEMAGPNLGVIYNYISGYGVENFVYNIYDYATNGTQLIYAFVEEYNAEMGAISFSFVRHELTDYGAEWVQVYSVSLTIEDGVITAAYINSAEYEAGSYTLDTVNNTFELNDDAEPTTSKFFAITQTVGAREEGNNPYKAEELLILDLHIYNQATGEEIKNGDTVEIMVGKDNALAITLPEADVEKAGFNGLEINVLNNWSYSVVANTYNYPYLVYTYNKAGTYEVEFSSAAGGTVSFTLNILASAPTSLNGAVVVDGTKTETSEVSVIAGVNVTLGAVAASGAESCATTAEVTTGDPDAVTLTANGENWDVVVSEAGTYTITLTSTMNTVSTSIKLVVVEAPTPAELLVGTYKYDLYGETATVKFSPIDAGEVSGTVTIAFDNNSYWDRLQFNETAAYDYIDGAIVLTHVSGDGLDYVAELKINESYEIELLILPYGPMMPDYTVSYVLEKTEDEVVEEQPAGEGNGTMAAPYVLSDSTVLDLNLGAEDAVYYTFVPSTNGTLTITVTADNENWSVGVGTFNFMLLDVMFTNTKEIEVTAGTTVYILASTWGEASAYSVALDFAGEAPAGPTLADLAGTWNGSEYSTIVSKTVTSSLSINADGTGTGSYNDGWDRSFTIVSMAIDGNTVVMTWNEGRNDKTLTFTYENGTLTAAQGFYFGALTMTKEAGSDVGGDVEGGEDEGDPLAKLVGTWTGSEYSSIVSATVTSTITVYADGTGVGSYNDGWDRSFTIVSMTIDGDTVTMIWNEGRNDKTMTFTYADGVLSAAQGFYWGALTMTKEAAEEEPAATEVTGGSSYDYAYILDLTDGVYTTTVGAGEKVYFMFQHDYASMTAVYEITFVVTSGDCTLYSVTVNMMGQNEFAVPVNYCISSIDANAWVTAVALENTTDAAVTYTFEVSVATVEA